MLHFTCLLCATFAFLQAEGVTVEAALSPQRAAKAHGQGPAANDSATTAVDAARPAQPSMARRPHHGHNASRAHPSSVCIGTKSIDCTDSDDTPPPPSTLAGQDAKSVLRNGGASCFHRHATSQGGWSSHTLLLSNMVASRESDRVKLSGSTGGKAQQLLHRCDRTTCDLIPTTFTTPTGSPQSQAVRRFQILAESYPM